MTTLRDKLIDGVKGGAAETIRFTPNTRTAGTDGIVGPVPVETTIDANGQFTTPDLVPGRYTVRIKWRAVALAETYDIAVPASGSNLGLWPLIAEYVALPPDTPQELIAKYFAEHPVEGGGGLSESAVTDIVETVGDTRYAPIATVDLATFLNPGETMPNTGTVDAQPLFQRALAAAAALTSTSGPISIRIPAGRFRINSSVRWFAGYHVGFVGAGRENTRILPTGEAVFGLMDPSFPTGQFLDGQVFADMTIDCINQVSGANNVGAKGIAMRWMRGGRFQRIRILDSWATSFGCDFLQDTSFVECTAIRSGRGVTGGNDSFGAGFGIGVGNFEVESVSFVNCYAEGSHSAGFFIERLLDIPTPKDSRGFSLVDCTSVGGYNGLRDAGGDGLLISGCHFLNASNAGVHVDGYSSSGRHGGRNGNISGSVVRGNGVGVLVGNAATGGYMLDNNEITNNVGAGVSATGQLGPGWRFARNRVEGNGAGGILLDSPLVVRPELIANVVRNNGTGDGIRISGDVVEPRITDNTVQGHRGIGISLPDATKFCTDPWVKNNICTENSGGGIVTAKLTTPDSSGIVSNRATDPFSTITNLFTTPSYQVDVSQVAALSRLDAPTQVTGGAKSGTAHARLVVNQAGSASARIARVSGTLVGAYTLSAWVRADKAVLIRPYAIGYWASNASQRTWHRGGIRATGDWQRVSITVVLPSNGSRIDLNIGLDSATVGMVLDVDAAMVTAGTALWPYFDGDTAGATWSGTAHASTSALTVGTPTLADNLYTASGGETPLVAQVGAATASGLNISMAQPLTVYSVVTGTPVASMRAALRTGTAADRFGVGRNSGNTAWVAVGTDSAAAAVNAQVTAAANPAVVSAARDASGLTAHVRGLTPVTTAVASYDPASSTRLVNDTGVTHTLVYAGAHDATKRAAVMDVLAANYGVA
nr:right-handed parallel beta-helix repeat-containing protein [Rhodococcus sp. 15-649-1-2]